MLLGAVIVDDKTVLDTAQLLLKIGPSIASAMQSVQDNPDKPWLMSQLRTLMAQAWATSDRKTLATSLDKDNSNTLYLELHEHAITALQTLCPTVKSTQLSATTAKCVCNTTAAPMVYCAALMNQELLTHWEAVSENSRRHRQLPTNNNATRLCHQTLYEP